MTEMQRNNLFLKFRIRSFFAKKIQYLRVRAANIKGYDIHPSVILERHIHLDRLYPRGIHIQGNCLIASGVTILSHDHCKRVNNQPLLTDTYIGKRCFIAVGATILPGVKIGDEVIVGAGSVVTRDVPSNVIVAGNPARIIRENIRMNEQAMLINWNKENGWSE
jgi:acetyltransferase-like isoleucine patch superfamily enzyme